MRFLEFQSKMKKPVFTLAEARIVINDRPLPSLRLALHRWTENGNLISMRRGVYAFADRPCSMPEMLAALYPPAYISLESALNQLGLLPDVPFETTLVAPRPTRSFDTPRGRFHFHRIHQRLFFGYDPGTFLGEPEKVLLDYFYFRGASMRDDPAFWRESRLQNLEPLRWGKGDRWARLYPVSRVRKLWNGLKRYAKTSRSY
ncbi:MAG: hypothetical protein HY551_03850 [Elusimicrobia bacterium]|nr:hypothetical protein [Elusimicrobiota bacterium]